MRMVPFVRRWLALLFGVAGIWFAVERWLWFHNLPRHASARFCGNCFLGAVGVPTELGLLGLVVVAMSLSKIPYSGASLIGWCFAALGILFTSAVVGVPLFTIGFIVLVVPIVFRTVVLAPG